MSTRLLRLEQVTRTEFDKLIGFWKEFLPTTDGRIVSRLYNPISKRNYRELFKHFLRMENADQIRVRVNDDEWMKGYVRKLCRKDIEKMIELADSNSWKAYYLQLKIRKNRDPMQNRSVIDFRECGGYIVSYSVKVTYEQKELFGINAQEQFKDNIGMWVPRRAKSTENYLNFRNGNSLKKR